MKINFKNQTLRIALVSSFALGSAFVASSSYAGSATANMPVTASIAANCTITASTLAFGAYDPIVTNLTANLNNTATLSTTCTTGSSPLITFDQGANAATGSTASAPARQLKSGTNTLNYALFSDSARTSVWGSTGVAPPTSTGTVQTSTVYGDVIGGQNKPVGTYADTVVATIAF